MTDDNPPRTCDFCSSARAVLYCAADSAKLCLSCDREVHSTNQLFTKHTRSLLCDACDSSSSTILCSSESLSLCHNCDFDSHRHSHSSPHDRRPLEGFTGCPSVEDLATWLGFEGVDLKGKGLVGGDEYIGFGDFDGDCLDLLVWDTPTIVSIDDLIASNGSDRSFQAMGVPPLPKNRKAACGKYKEEILSQLREMAKSEPSLNDGHEDVKPITEFQFSGHQQDLYPADMYSGFGNSVESPKLPRFKGGSFWCTNNVDFANESLSSELLGSSFDDSVLVPDKDSDINGDASLVKSFLVPDKDSNYGHDEQPIHNIKTESQQALPKFNPRELTSQERDYAISRYKEKRRTRRFDKHVRYESRKIRAESRTRIKGRFAKIDHQGTGMQ